MSALTAIFLAAIITVPVFVAMHVPIRLYSGVVGDALVSNLVRVGIWGFVFTFLYASSRNLWLVIGIHAITNRRCLWVEPESQLRPFELSACILLIAALTVIQLARNTLEARNRSVHEGKDEQRS